MIEGHGDDAYKYKAIKINFSSNVYNHVDHSGLHQHLFQQMESIRTYPEPEPYSLEKVLAKRFHLSSEEVCVTNGATEAIFNSSDIQESDFGYLDADFQRICGCLSSAWS